MESGVYIIRCLPTGELYVGGTKIKFERRVVNHKSALRDGHHHVRLLQARWDEYGPDAFEFVFLKSFPVSEVHMREREAIRRLKPAFNLSQRPVGCPRGQSHQDAARYRIDGLDLTIGEMAAMTGLTIPTIRARINRGLTGQDLIAKKHKAKRKVYTLKQ